MPEGKPNILVIFLATFVDFPPGQKAASFTIDQALERLSASLTAGR